MPLSFWQNYTEIELTKDNLNVSSFLVFLAIILLQCLMSSHQKQED